MDYDLNSRFNQSAEDVKKLPKRPTNDEILNLYGLYKQSIYGNNNTERPGFMDFTAKSKWDAWKKHLGKNSDTAKKEYIRYVRILQNRYKNGQ